MRIRYSWCTRSACLLRLVPYRSRLAVLFSIVLALAFFATPSSSHATVVTLKNGMQIEGAVVNIASVSEDPFKNNPGGGEVKLQQIVMMDDNLRRIFFYTNNVQSVSNSPPALQERIQIEQRTASSGRRLGVIGSIHRITPFDKFGRRVFTMSGPDGALDIIQGITLVTPQYTKLEGLLVNKNAYIWDMRVATNSIPRETLSQVLSQYLPEDNANERLRIVRLYIQAERYKDAGDELRAIIERFPDLAELKKQEQALRQLEASRSLREIELRQQSGQYLLAYQMLNGFPSDGVAGETLLKVKQMLDEYNKRIGQRDRIVELLNQHYDQVTGEDRRQQLKPLLEEIENELSFHTLERMADYLRLSDDAELPVEQKLALAVSGWLVGTGGSTENLPNALSIAKARELVVAYLNSDREPDRRTILNELDRTEGAAMGSVASLLAAMKPSKPTEPVDEGIPGLYELSVPGLSGEDDVRYTVQLPPEYHPHRRYPCVVTLHGGATTPAMQIDWWAGGYSEGLKMRLGQASRHGYIVIAPQWAKRHQVKYEYSAREHAAVLYSLRDACRRFSVDTDRVFLSGHSSGGDAAWDMALAHPDLWAGVIPIVATSDKYVARYWHNGKYVPMYFVCGQMDANRMALNARDLDRYLTRAGYDCVVSEYQGRGHEPFNDEIQNLFKWMNLSSHQRDFFPKKFQCVTMRPWDNFFWWVEAEKFPERSMVLPVNWPAARASEAPVQAEITPGNTIRVDTAGSKVTVYFSPRMIDFDQKSNLVVNRRAIRQEIQPSLQVMLEDVRSRADRQNPFWAKIVVE